LLQCTRCLRALPTADGGATVESHLGTCRYWPTTEEVRRTRLALGPDALPPVPPPPGGPYHNVSGPFAQRKARIARHLWGRRAQPGPGPHGSGWSPTASPAPGPRPHRPGHRGPLLPSARRPRTAPLVVCPMWEVVAGPAAGIHMPGRLRPHVGALTEGPPGLAEAPATGDRHEVPAISGPAEGRPDRLGHLNHSDRRPVCRAEVEQPVLCLATPPPQAGHGAGPPCTMPHLARRPEHTRPRAERVLPRATWHPLLRQGGFTSVLRGCGGQPGPATPGQGGRRTMRFCPIWCRRRARRFVSPFLGRRRARRFSAFWTKAQDAFAQPWDYPCAGALWANPPFSRLDEVVPKASREGCLMLIVDPEWSGPGCPWWAPLCALCPRRWCFPEGRPVYLRGGTDLVPDPG